MTDLADQPRQRRAWILVGPTAAGKTAVSNELARRLGADVLSADSMLVYRGLDIGTAKPTRDEQQGLVLHGIDLAAPDERFSVGAWLAAAKKAFDSAEAAGRDLVVAGGTGLYINALLRGLDSPPADMEILRPQIQARFEAGGVDALRAYAEQLSPGSVETLADPDNPRRLTRLIEKLSADPASSAGRITCHGHILAGLQVEPKILEIRIIRRIEKMFADGLLDEVAALRHRYPAFSETAGQGIGYAEAMAVLDGRMTREEAATRIALRTRHLAKRQRTWFRHQLEVDWVAGPEDARDVPRAADQVLEVWKRHGKTPVSV